MFSKSIYLFINNYLVPFKGTSLRYNTLMPAFFPILKTLLFRIANSSSFDCSFISSIVAKCFPFFGVFSFGKTKESAGVKSGEYGG